jgi:galactofuranosylgalactofuranosylrhamnosyl-N-acetylglucosaminyl-diphospho-decaprenol beta-1,5/1,6-galactofuranosyltransferase
VTDSLVAAPATEETVTELVLQRFVLPVDADFDTLPLYVEGGEARPEPEISVKGKELVSNPPRQPPVLPDTVLGRRALLIPAGTRVSTATYFNSFAASYWRRWTDVTQVTLRVRVTGTADVLVSRSNSRGDQQRVAKERVNGGGAAEFTLPLTSFGDGGWYWFDVVAGFEDVTLEGAEWIADKTLDEPGRISIGITTFNRPTYCVDLLRSLASDPEVLERVDMINVVDQGTTKVENDPAYASVAEVLGSRLTVIHQANLGGSGGFSRGMYEAAYHSTSKYVLLLDDDVLVEPDGVLRAITFADLCRIPTIVGGHMLNMHVRSMLHAFGERVNKYRFFWGPAPHTKHAHDFAVSPLRATRWLHRRIDVDYNGWWMCLIPTDVVRSIGLAIPLFIKWDDAEFGMRAQEAGVPTVSLPGAAVWHVPWTDKDDTLDWQAYHHARNRTLAALLHSPYERGGRLLPESMAIQLKHGLAMQYSAAELRLWALEDILSGPEHLHRDLPTKLSEIRIFRASEDDAVVNKDPIAFPPVRLAKPLKRGKDPTEPGGSIARYVAAATGVVRQFTPVRATSLRNPEARVPAQDMRWWLLSRFDSAVVSTADGVGASWYKRDRKRFLDLMRRSLDVHQRLAVNWSSLQEQYQDAVPEVTDPDVWIKTWSDGGPG